MNSQKYLILKICEIIFIYVTTHSCVQNTLTCKFLIKYIHDYQVQKNENNYNFIYKKIIAKFLHS